MKQKDDFFVPIEIIIDGSIEKKQKYNYEYDEKGNLLCEIESKSVANVWENKLKRVFEYNSSDQEIRRLVFRWKDNQWYNSLRSNYSYDSYGNKICELCEIFEDTKWIIYSKIIFVYNNGKILNITRRRLVVNDFMEDREIYTYDGYGNLLSIYKKYEGSSDDEKDIYSYDSQGNILSKSKQYFKNGVWANHNKNIYTYDNKNNLLINLEYYWENGKWENTNEILYSYDDNGKLITKDSKYWLVSENKDKGSHSKVIYTYDNDGNLISEYYQSFQSIRCNWVFLEDIISYYDNFGNCIFKKRTADPPLLGDVDISYNKGKNTKKFSFRKDIRITYKSLNMSQKETELYNFETNTIREKDNLLYVRLIDAIVAKDFNVISELLDEGADINCEDFVGNTLLNRAVLRDDYELVKYLIQNGVDLDKIPRKDKLCDVINPAIILAIQSKQNKFNIIKLLVENGCNVNNVNTQGTTALMVASRCGDIEVVKYLINNGADVKIKSYSGRTALKYAREFDNKDIEILLSNIENSNNSLTHDDN